ncbi:MAG: sulfatase-like hydrolase/transferase [Sphingomonadaceae bacterium]|nr:sulfatase-like hydrolase/transferase [Sphingomonadaceae bacterium]
MSDQRPLPRRLIKPIWSRLTLAAMLAMAPVAAVAPSAAQARGATTNVQSARNHMRPNIIVILADDMGYGDVGAYGSAIRTPNIDALARNGIRYTTAYATAPICSPSRAGLLSGRSQQRFGFHFNITGRGADVGMPGSETTFAEVARSAGYITAAVGKWHVGNGNDRFPTEQGFDSFYGFVDGATRYFADEDNDFVSTDTGQDGLITRQRFPILDGRNIVQPRGNITDIFTDRAVQFVGQNRDRPFLLYLAYNAPHTPLQASAEDVLPFANLPSPYERIYRAMVTRMDAGIGRVMAAVREAGLSEQTIVIFASDNGCPNYDMGACSNDPFAGYKAFPLEGGIRVPLIIHAPGMIRARRVERRPVSTLDILPTIAHAVGAATPPAAEGRDLLSSNSLTRDRALFWRMGPNHWVRQGRWKLVVMNRSSTLQQLHDVMGRAMRQDVDLRIPEIGQWIALFDLQRDPRETRNVAARHPREVARLQRLFAEWDRNNQDPAFGSRREFRTEIDGERVQLIF